MGRLWKGIVALVLLVVVIAAVKTLCFEVMYIQGGSMMPTLRNRQYVVVSKVAYGSRCPRNAYEVALLGTLLCYVMPIDVIDSALQHAPDAYRRIGKARVKRGDIVAFNMPYYLNSLAVKRCVGMPGDSVSQHWGKVLPTPLIPYKGMRLSTDNLTAEEQMRLKKFYFFKEDETGKELIATMNFYFMVGDNRNHSTDSRNWGLLPEDHILGKVVWY